MTSIRVVPHEAKARPEPRGNYTGKAITLGPAVTTGAFRCEWQPERIVLSPLPDLPAFDLELDAPALMGETDIKVSVVRAVNRLGNTVRKVQVKSSGSKVRFTTVAGVFAYHVELTR